MQTIFYIFYIVQQMLHILLSHNKTNWPIILIFILIYPLMLCYINKINAYICCIEHLLSKYSFPHFHYCGQNINITLYAALEFLIDSITLYMFYFKKRNSNYTRNDQCHHTNDAILTNEKTKHSIWTHYQYKNCTF